MAFHKVPFRGSTERAQLVKHSVYDTDFQQVPCNDILRNGNKVFVTIPSSVTTWHLLPEGEGFLMIVSLFIRRTFIRYLSGGSFDFAQDDIFVYADIKRIIFDHTIIKDVCNCLY